MSFEKNLIDNPARKSAHPAVFLFLTLPFGVIGGYLTVTLAFLFAKAGVSIEQVAGLVAASLIPQMFKFLWAPLIDTTLSVKKWFVISTVISALCMLITGFIPINAANMVLFTIIIIITNVAISFISIAMNTLSAYDTSESVKGRVSGYIQAGNMGGTGVGGGVGLWLAQQTAVIWVPAAVLALVSILCCAALWFVKEPEITVKAEKVKVAMSNVLRDVWLMVKAKAGMLALILALMPIGTCAAGTLFAAIARDWHAGADVVALVTGVVGGFITGFGSLAGGWICDKIDRKNAYLWFGIFQVICLVAMAYLPHTQTMYIIWTLIYSVSAGMAYAGYNAFVLEAVGKGAAATKFEICSSISNVPIYLMTFIEGLAYTRWGATGLLNTEAVCACIAVGLFIVIRVLINQKLRGLNTAAA